MNKIYNFKDINGDHKPLLSNKFINCLGSDERLEGQSLDPEPPERITGLIFIFKKLYFLILIFDH